jgi:hypothetical protein
MKKEQLKNQIIKVKKMDDDEIIGYLPIKIEKYQKKKRQNKDNIIKELKNEISKLNNVINKLTNKKPNNMIHIYESNFKNSKCWWCKNHFKCPSLGLPKCYSNDNFLLEGNFCSFNCMLSYSIDIKDNEHWKRKSLINYFYYKTYGKYRNIIPAPHWKSLDDFGGPLTIEEFRNELILNSKEYLLLEPPVIPRTTYTEELARTKSSNNKYVLKRSKPIKSNVYNINKFLN